MPSDPTTAQAQGATEADSSANEVSALGLGGVIVYYDLKYYDSSAKLPSGYTCGSVASAFVKGWVNELKQKLPKTGVYGSPLDAADWQNVPDDVWIAKTDKRATVWGLNISDALWPTYQRIHQYVGGHNETWGGLRFNIDTDVEDAVIVSNSGVKTYSWTFNAFDCFPGAGDYASTMNDVGQIAGTYNTTNGSGAFTWWGYLYSKGTCTSLQYQSATSPNGINNLGHIVGVACLVTPPCDVANGTTGFLYKNSAFTQINYPGAASTSPQMINDDDEIVGYFEDAYPGAHGFLLQGTKWTQIDCPGVAAETLLYGTNGDNHMIGYCPAYPYGFVYHPEDGTFNPLPLPGGETNSAPLAIDNNDQVPVYTSSNQFAIYNPSIGFDYSLNEAASFCTSGWSLAVIDNVGGAVGSCGNSSFMGAGLR